MPTQDTAQSSSATDTKHRVRRAEPQTLPQPPQTVEVVIDAIGRIIRGTLPLVIVALSGTEIFDPALLPHAHISTDFAQALFGGGLAAYGINLIYLRVPYGVNADD